MRNRDHPGVSIVPGNKPTAPYHISFKHPLMRSKQVKRSCRTSDGKSAQKYAIELSDILRNPNVWNELPNDVSPVVRSLWNVDISGSEFVSAVMAHDPSNNFILTIDDVFRDRHAEYATLAEESARILLENQVLNETVARLEAQVENLAGLLQKVGFEAAREYSPKLLSKACEDFLCEDPAKNGTSAGPRKKASWRSCLNRFVASQPASICVHEISAQMVIDYLALLHSGKLPQQMERPALETVRTASKVLCAMLEHQTNGTFRKVPVRIWMKRYLKNDIESPDNPYWLNQCDVDSLRKHLTPFWRNVATIQWEGGFRPEELCYLRRESVTLEDQIRIEVGLVKVNGAVIWKPKTKNSYGRVHLREVARETLTHLTTGDSYLLFPNDCNLHGGIATQWKKSEENFKHLNLWRAESFTKQYLTALRAAAKSAGLDYERLDGRTLRRSCGKRVLLESNFNIELAAAVLRDHPETVRKHYARLIPADVCQPG